MKKLQGIIISAVGAVLVAAVIIYAVIAPKAVVHAPSVANRDAAQPGNTEQILPVGAADDSIAVKATPVSSTVPSMQFVGPRDNVPKDAPAAYGFWSFAMPVSNVISRSGQPLLSEFKWLKDNGWKGDVDLRHDGEYNDPSADDSKLPGFTELGFNYLHLDILDGHAPTDDQAQQFLAFVTNPVNQPVHVHCRGGYGRAGTMTVLYRYAVQGWPLDKAVAESRLFHGGISDAQLKWLTSYAETHPAGSYK